MIRLLSQRLAALSLLLAICALPVSARQPTDTEEASVVYVEANGISSGTGFVVAPGRVVTNAHVVRPDAPGFTVILPNSTTRLAARPLWVDRQADVALLEVTGLQARALPVSLVPPRRGDPVYAVGYPGSSLGFQDRSSPVVSTTTNGRVTSLFTTRFIPNGPRYPAIQHNAAVGHGNSGGPLFDDCGRVIGITTLGPLGPNGEPIADQTFIASTTPQLHRLMNAAGHNVLATVSTPCGGPVEDNRRAPPQPDSSFSLSDVPVWAWAAGGLVLLGAIGLLAGYLARRRGGGDVPAAASPPPPAAREGSGWQFVPLGGGAPLVLNRERLASRFGQVIGRNPQFSDLTIESDTISRRHARLALVGGRLVVEDLNSAQGTTVGSTTLQPFRPQSLSVGDTVRLGDRSFRIEPHSGAGPAPRPRFSTYLIGRHSKCDLQLGDNSASRSHAELVVSEGGAALLSDRGSSQGTFVKSGTSWKRITHVQLEAGMMLRFGDSKVPADRLLASARSQPASNPAPAEQQMIRRNPADGSIIGLD